MYSIPELNEIKIYYLNLKAVSRGIIGLQDNLIPQEVKIAGKFKFEEDRARYIIARSCLRVILGDFLSIEPIHIKISLNKFGKPTLLSENFESVKFNLSHSGDLIVYAFSLFDEVGIDIEIMNEHFDHLKIAENYFSSDEFIFLNSSNDRFEITDRFFRIWTRKEALLKAVGTGFLPDLRKIDVLQDEIKLNFSPDELPEYQTGNFNVFDLSIHNYYKSAIACSGEKKRISIKQINF